LNYDVFDKMISIHYLGPSAAKLNFVTLFSSSIKLLI